MSYGQHNRKSNAHQQVSTTDGGNIELGTGGVNPAQTTTPAPNSDNNSSSWCGCFGLWEWLMGFGEWFTDRELTNDEVIVNHRWLIVWLIGLSVTAACVTESFWYVDYKHYALEVNNYHGVTSHETYGEGRYFFTLDKKVIQFGSTFTEVDFTSSTFAGDGLEFELDAELYYRLPKDSVGEIYDKFATNYHDRVKKNAITTTKGIASTFSVDEFLSNRTYIEDTIAAALEVDLLATVGVDAPGSFVKIVAMRFPALLITTSLDTALALQRNKVQEEQQTVDLIVAETNNQKAAIDVQTVQTGEFATNKASEIIATSEADATKILLVTRSDGVQSVFTAIGMTSPVEKNKLNRIFSVMDNPHDTTTMFNGVETVLVQA